MKYKIVKTIKELITVPVPKDYAEIPEIKKGKPKYACSLRQIEGANIVAWYADFGNREKDWRAVSHYFIVEETKSGPFIKKYEEKKRKFILDNAAAANIMLSRPFVSSNKELKEFLKKAKQEIGYPQKAVLQDIFKYLCRMRIEMLSEIQKPRFTPKQKAVRVNNIYKR